MIVVNIYLEGGCDPREGEYEVMIAGIVNETFVIDEAPDKVVEAIREADTLIDYMEKNGEGVYEVQLENRFESEGYGGWYYFGVVSFRKLPAHDVIYEDAVKGEEIRRLLSCCQGSKRRRRP